MTTNLVTTHMTTNAVTVHMKTNLATGHMTTMDKRSLHLQSGLGGGGGGGGGGRKCQERQWGQQSKGDN